MMRTERPPSGRSIRIRTRGVALVAAAIAGLWAVGARLAAATSASWQEVLAPGPARLEDAIGGLTGAAALGVVGWLGLAVLTSALAALLPASVPAVRALAAAIAPRVIRHGVAVAVGAVLVGGVATSAHAASDPGIAARAAAASVVDPARKPGILTPAERAGVPAVVDVGWRATGAEVSPGWVPTPPVAAAPGPRPRAAAVSRPRPGATVDDEVVVRRGDTLWSIAARHLGPGATAAEIAHEWPRWHAANRDVLGGDPDRLSPGQRLRPPQVVTTMPESVGAGLGGGR